MNARLGLAAVMALLVAACGGASSPSPSSTPGPAPGPVLSAAELKLRLVDARGPLWYCDPDFYPIQRQDELISAQERWAEVTADPDAFRAIAAAQGIEPAGPLADAQKLALYQVWKSLNAIALDPIGNDTYRFDYLAQPRAGAAEGTRTAGTITTTGSITIEQQVAAGEPICPICLGRGSRIDAPQGRIAVEDLRIGDAVWTVDPDGGREIGTVIALGSTTVPANHHVIRLVLVDGRTVTASPGHPLADGRLMGDLRPGDPVAGSTVASAEEMAYDGGRTFDVVVGGSSGTYFVDGIPLGSTLQP